MPKQAGPADAGLLIWLLIDRTTPDSFIARLTATRGPDSARHHRQVATSVEAVCRAVRSWLEEELVAVPLMQDLAGGSGRSTPPRSGVRS